MATHSTIELTEEQERKREFVDRLRKEGKEIYYMPVSNMVHSDLNGLWTDTDLVMCTLRHLDKDIAKAAEGIMKTGISIDDKVRLIAKSVRGKTFAELTKAYRMGENEINVPVELVGELKRLKPTSLIIHTRVPRVVASIYIREKIDPLYNCYGEPKAIIPYATVLQYENSMVTGEIDFIPDEDFRSGMRCRV